MNNIRPSLVVFPVAGLCSGICSGISVVLQPLGIIAPGIFFGLALAHSINASVTRLSTGQRFSIVTVSTGGYILAGVACLLCARLPEVDSWLFQSALAGIIAGTIGAMTVATSFAFTISAMSLVRTLLIVPVAGALLGAGFMILQVYLSDFTSFGHPYDDIVSFPLWQIGVASVIPFCRSSYGDETTT